MDIESTPDDTSTQMGEKCPDGIWDEAEQQDPGLCPEDIPEQGESKGTDPVQSFSSQFYNIDPDPELLDLPSTSDLFVFEKTVQITTPDTYRTGCFCRISYVPAKDLFAITFTTGHDVNPMSDTQSGNEYINEKGQAYVEYSPDLENTGVHGYTLTKGGGDTDVEMHGNDYYLVAGAPEGWRIRWVDMRDWSLIGEIMVEMDRSKEASNDMMIAYVNDQVMVSSLYNKDNLKADVNQKDMGPRSGEATHNRIYTPDLNVVKERFILDDVEHINGGYMLFANGLYHFVTSSAFFGDLIVIQYDQDWNFVGSKKLLTGGQWSQRAVYDNQRERFYVPYIDIVRKGRSDVRLAAFDKEWNLLEVIAVTDHYEEPPFSYGRPSLTLHDGKIYLAYDKETMPEPGEEKEGYIDGQCLVSVYEVGK